MDSERLLYPHLTAEQKRNERKKRQKEGGGKRKKERQREGTDGQADRQARETGDRKTERQRDKDTERQRGRSDLILVRRGCTGGSNSLRFELAKVGTTKKGAIFWSMILSCMLDWNFTVPNCFLLLCRR